MRDNPTAYQRDLAAILTALGLSDHARDYSPHEVVQRDILPAIARLRTTVEQVDVVAGQLETDAALFASTGYLGHATGVDYAARSIRTLHATTYCGKRLVSTPGTCNRREGHAGLCSGSHCCPEHDVES